MMKTPRSSPLVPGPGVSGDVGLGANAEATAGVTALYQEHAVGLLRLAIVMLGERTAAEDVVQDAFFGLYQHWAKLRDPAKALPYVRSAVLNRCRTALRDRNRGFPDLIEELCESAETTVLVGAEQQRVLLAIRALPDRQREALVLRYYLDMSELDMSELDMSELDMSEEEIAAR
jgi:RNA polymerase sigma factor (sigma-70 family)